MEAPLARDEAERWLESWDRQQERYLPDREERFGFLVGLVDAAPSNQTLAVLDLACGPGSLTRRLLARRPATKIVAVDLDPVLLSIYRSLFPSVAVIEADLRTDAWYESVEGHLDAVVTATALHWLDAATLQKLYRELAGLIRPGGVFLNADHVPFDDRRGLSHRCAVVIDRERDALRGDRHDWESWWSAIEEHPMIGTVAAERNRRFADRGPEFAPPVEWHLDALRAAGFSEGAVVWRRGRDAIVAAVR